MLFSLSSLVALSCRVRESVQTAPILLVSSVPCCFIIPGLMHIYICSYPLLSMYQADNLMPIPTKASLAPFYGVRQLVVFTPDIIRTTILSGKPGTIICWSSIGQDGPKREMVFKRRDYTKSPTWR